MANVVSPDGSPPAGSQPASDVEMPTVHRGAIAALVAALAALILPLAVVCFQPVIASLLQLGGGGYAVVRGMRARREVLRSYGFMTGEGAAMGGVLIGAMVCLMGVLDFVVGLILTIREYS